jgi:RNA polymerase sigma-70 factor (ECF subfamily)
VFQEDLPLSDESLVERCRAGDERAWEALVRRHAGAVYRVARRTVRRTDEAEDLAQEIFLKVSQSLERYDRHRPFRPWLLQVARNHAIDNHRSHWRERKATIELDALPVAPGSRPATQEHRVLTGERRHLIERGLAELPEPLRDAVVLRDLDGLDYDEIAQVLSVPLGTVKSRINRGRLQLAQALADRREELS